MNFEEIYLKVREKEKRVYTDEEVLNLPYIKKEHPHFKEWDIRKSSFEKLKRYLFIKGKPIRILELGCGNGWLTNGLSKIHNSTVVGVDVNTFEIEQAKRVFENNLLIKFISTNILENGTLQLQKFDIIVLSAAIQYFKDLNVLVNILMAILIPGGEIHITDSHLYNVNERDKAAASSLQYYSDLGYEGMSHYYYHHQWSELEKFNYRVMNRSIFVRILLKLFKSKGNYFPWIIIRKD